MIKISLLLLIFVSTLLSPLHGHDHTPMSDNSLGIYGNIRFFQKYQNFNFLLDYSKSKEEDNFEPQKFRLGGRYRFHKSFKLGVFVSRLSNQRYDDDWVLSNGDWVWANTEDRQETHLQIEGIYRSFLTKKLVLEFRNLFNFNRFNDQQTYQLRSGLTYFHFDEGVAKYSLFTQYEASFPLNYSEKTIWQHWLYFGSLFHLSKNFSIGPFTGYRLYYWTTSAAVRSVGEEEYVSKFDGFIFGGNVIVRNLF